MKVSITGSDITLGDETMDSQDFEYVSLTRWGKKSQMSTEVLFVTIVRFVHIWESITLRYIDSLQLIVIHYIV